MTPHSLAAYGSPASARVPELATCHELPEVLRHLFRNAATLADAIAHAVHYGALLHPGFQSALAVTDDRAVWTWQRGKQTSQPEPGCDSWVRYFAHPGHWAERRADDVELLTLELGRNAACYSAKIVFSRRSLGARGFHTDRTLEPLLQQLADDALRRSAAPSCWVARVRAALGADDAGGPPDIDVMGRRLGVSSRTLRRRLEDEQSSYSELLEEWRKQRAKELLRELALNVSEVATALGYADPNAFARAYKRWFGTAPSAERRAAVRARRMGVAVTPIALPTASRD